MPGLYTNVPSYLHQYPIYEYGFYPRVFDNELLADRVKFSNCEYLFSFVGNSKNYPKLRQQILNLSHSEAYLEDSFSENTKLEKTYTDILKVSKFVLCPRGIAASTFRVFETMRSARVPVIISDDWLPPLGLEWNEFSIKISENDVDLIPDLLKNIEDKAEEMGKRAFDCWQANFAIETSFDWIVKSALRIQSLRQNYSDVIKRNLYIESIQQGHFTRFWKELIRGKLSKI